MTRTIRLAAAVIAGLSALWAGPDVRNASRFPIRVSDNRRHFEDREGRPFLIQGDTAWSLLAQLTLTETESYLDRRKAQGFNAVLVNLIENKFSAHPPKNASGDEPFKTAGDLTTPNESYFAYADAVIGLAAARGILVFLTPAYLGWRGGDDGWFQEIRRAGPEKLRRYGRYVGGRYRGSSNVVWVLGGDFTPPAPSRWSIDALAEGIRESGAAQLMTVHCGQESPAGAFGGRPWLDFNNVYSYAPDLYRIAMEEYERKPARPYILLEGLYEGEHDSSPEIIRRQAYGSLIAGAAGHFFGNNPIWNFNSPDRVFATDLEWPQALDSRGAQDMSRLWGLFRDLRWHGLVPDDPGRYLTVKKGRAGPDRPPLAAATPDGRLLVAYISASRSAVVTVKMKALAAPSYAFWYDPTNGARALIPASVFSGQEKMKIAWPGTNASGDGDWVLVLDAEGKEGKPTWRP